MIIKSQKGFSLIEALIAIAILAIAIGGLISLQTSFAKGTVDRTVINSLIDAASSALTQCQADENTASSLSYKYEDEDKLIVNVYLDKSCNVPKDECSLITATSSAKGKTFKLSTYVCNFRQEV